MKKYLVPLMIILVSVLIITGVLLKRKVITLVIDGKEKKLVTFKNTVKEALDSKKISLGAKDKIEPSLDSKISNKGTINIKRAVNVTVIVEGKELKILSAEKDIDSMLRAEQIDINNDDKIKPSKETQLSQDMTVEIVRVETKTLKEALAIDFKTVVKNDSDLPNTKKRITQEGIKGEKKVTYSVVYEDGKEVSRSAISEIITKKPIDKIVVQGTYPLAPISRGGDPVPYSKVFKARATAYSAIRGIGKTYTASGRLAVRDPNGYSTIAVDPSIIPFGTKLFVEGYGFAIAADSGTGIIGNSIDVFFDTYRESCDWAVKYVNVYILK